MSEILKQLSDEITASRESPAGYARRLRNELGRAILERIDELEWTQSQLAIASGMPESSISRLVHGKTNWETETAGRVLYALGVLPGLIAKRTSQRPKGLMIQMNPLMTRGEPYGQANFTTQAKITIFDTYPKIWNLSRELSGWEERGDAPFHTAPRSPIDVGGPNVHYAKRGLVQGGSEFLHDIAWK